MPDNTFTVGAAVNVEQLATGMNEAGEVTQEALDKLLTSFQEASTGTARAVSRITEDTRAAALDVDASWKRVAEATLTYNAAVKEASAATYLARKAGQDDAAAVNLLAAAKEKAALATAELAAAQKVAAGEAEAEALSMKELGGRINEIFGELIGVTIGIEMFKHVIEGAAEFNVQMRNLSLTTGIGASTLAGLHDVVKENGGDFDAVSVGLSKMLKAQQAAVDGGEKQIAGFKRVGVSVNELKTLSPDELFFRVAEGFQELGSSAERNAAAVDIFGKGGRGLIFIFELLGPLLREHVEEAAKLSGVTDESTTAAAKWHQVMDQISVAMRALGSEVLPALVASMPVFAAIIQGVLAPIKTVIDITTTLLYSLFEAFVGLGKIIYDVVTGDFGAIVADASEAKDRFVAVWKSGGKDIAAAWTGGDELIAKLRLPPPKAPKPTETDVPGGGGKTRLADWRQELQSMKDAEDGFHELSKSEEAKFWEAKLETARGDAKLYGEVYHLMRDAERAAQKDSLKEEEQAVRQRLAGTKAGSAERVAILQEEVGHLKAIGADQTDDYKRLQTQLVAATKEYADQQSKAAVEIERQKVDATRKGSEERVAAETAVLSKLAGLGLQETAEYTKQAQRVTEAARQAAQERLKLQELDIEQAKISGIAKVEVERQGVQTEFDLHRINAQQRIAALKALEDEEYEIVKAALEKKLVLMQNDPTTSPVHIRQIQNQIENLTREHNNKLAQLDTQATKQSMQRFDQFFQHISQGFQTAINGMLTGTKSFSKGMQDLWNSLVTGFVQSLVKMGLAWVQHEVAKLIVHTTTNEGIVASDSAAAAQSESISLIATLKKIGHAAASAAAHAFKSVMEYVPFPLNIVLAPIAAAGAFAGVLAFQGLASAREGMVSGEEQLAFVHKNEMVLPAPLSLGFQSIIAGLAGAQTPAPAAAGSRGHQVSFGDLNYTQHNHQPAGQSSGPDTIARMVQKRISRKLGINL